MHWWIVWVVLVIAMIATICVGTLYAIRRGLAALHCIAALGDAVNERMEAMQEPVQESQREPVSFTQPLHQTAKRYSDAYAKVIARQDRKREQHEAVWRQWRTFNE
jgi:hypothetical protein